MEKVEQDQHISSHDIVKKLNIDHKTVLNHSEKAGYNKNFMFRCHMIYINNKKFNGSNVHLRIIAKTERNRTIF